MMLCSLFCSPQCWFRCMEKNKTELSESFWWNAVSTNLNGGSLKFGEVQTRNKLRFTFHCMIRAKGVLPWGNVQSSGLSPAEASSKSFPKKWAWISTLPKLTQTATVQKKKKISVTITDCHKNHWLSLFLFILAFTTPGFSNFQGKMSSTFIQIFYFLHSSFHVVVFQQAHNLFPSLSPGSDSSMPQARPSKTDFPSSQCHGCCSQFC